MKTARGNPAAGVCSDEPGMHFDDAPPHPEGYILNGNGDLHLSKADAVNDVSKGAHDVDHSCSQHGAAVHVDLRDPLEGRKIQEDSRHKLKIALGRLELWFVGPKWVCIPNCKERLCFPCLFMTWRWVAFAYLTTCLGDCFTPCACCINFKPLHRQLVQGGNLEALHGFYLLSCK
jgi:hypothetical protein